MEKCKFSSRCNHNSMSLVYCQEQIPQPVEKCLLYVLMEDVEKKKLKILENKEPLVRG